MTTALTDALFDIEAELKAIELWDTEPPSEEALSSTQPFCVDTLSLPQWLQFIFLPQMHTLIESEHPLPTKCGIAPIAEEYFRHHSENGDHLIALLNRIDEHLSRA
ncbi:YqcC family protein [Pseudomaricurvus sp.]|uniref:YqcC family protein n=1 Tax=Pseudomaricurvus sp. TaxID=2004510 RepID=UPI003F6AE5C0